MCVWERTSQVTPNVGALFSSGMNCYELVQMKKNVGYADWKKNVFLNGWVWHLKLENWERTTYLNNIKKRRVLEGCYRKKKEVNVLLSDYI